MQDVCHVYDTFEAIAQDVSRYATLYVTNKVISPGRMTHIRDIQTARCFTGLFSNTLTFLRLL